MEKQNSLLADKKINSILKIYLNCMKNSVRKFYLIGISLAAINNEYLE